MERTIDGPKPGWRPVVLTAVIIAVSIAGCGAARTADDWIRQLTDADVVRRRQACRELGNLPAEAGRIVPALTGAVQDDNWYVRHDAAIALGKLGPAATEAVPALVGILKDKEKSVRGAAGAALKKIDPDAAARAGVR
jgi:HEAT repeat protein